MDSQKEKQRKAQGLRLKQARIEAGFDGRGGIAGAARAYKFHKQNLADHEAGRRGIKPEDAQAYGKVFGVDPSWIMWGDEGPQTVNLFDDDDFDIEPDEIDADELAKALGYLLIRHKNTVPKARIDAAAVAAAEAYKHMAKVTNRRGAARLREALLLPLSSLLEVLYQAPPQPDETRSIASGVAVIYLGARHAQAASLTEAR